MIKLMERGGTIENAFNKSMYVYSRVRIRANLITK